METNTLLMMILILGIVWGGFATLLAHSMRAEKRRRTKSPFGAPPDAGVN